MQTNRKCMGGRAPRNRYWHEVSYLHQTTCSGGRPSRPGQCGTSSRLDTVSPEGAWGPAAPGTKHKGRGGPCSHIARGQGSQASAWSAPSPATCRLSASDARWSRIPAYAHTSHTDRHYRTVRLAPVRRGNHSHWYSTLTPARLVTCAARDGSRATETPHHRSAWEARTICPPADTCPCSTSRTPAFHWNQNEPTKRL